MSGQKTEPTKDSPKDQRVSKPTHGHPIVVHSGAMYLAKLLVGTDHLNPSQPCSTNYRLFSYPLNNLDQKVS